jgi:hypothetical protein
VAIPAPRPVPVDAVPPEPRQDPHRIRVALELGAGFAAGGRLAPDDPSRANQEAIDAAYDFGVFVGTRTQLYGIVLERMGLGRDHYGAVSASTTINTSYLVDTLWVAGRWYFSEERPAIYAQAAVGPALPSADATGTRPSSDPLVVPPVAYQCSDTGRVGLGVAAGIGAEFDIAPSWSLVSDARFSAHFMSHDAGAFGGCAPATGTALTGIARVAVQLRFGG